MWARVGWCFVLLSVGILFELFVIRDGARTAEDTRPSSFLPSAVTLLVRNDGRGAHWRSVRSGDSAWSQGPLRASRQQPLFHQD